MGHSFDLTHALRHLGVTALLVALLYAVILLVLRSVTRAGKPGGRRSKWMAGGPSRRQRRTERAMSRRKRRY